MRPHGQTDDGSVALSMIPQGAVVTVKQIVAGRGLRRHLANLGLLPGVRLEVLRGSMHGPVIVRVKGSKVMLGRGMAHGILVDASPSVPGS